MKILILFIFLLTLSFSHKNHAEVPSANTFSDMNRILFSTLSDQSYSSLENYHWDQLDVIYVLNSLELERKKAFFRAVFNGDLESLQNFFLQDVDVDITIKSILGKKTLKDLFQEIELQEFKPLAGFTPLYIAAMESHYEVAKFLIEKGANPNGIGKALYLKDCFLRPRDFESDPKIYDLFEKYKASASSCELFLPKLTFGFNLRSLFYKIGVLEYDKSKRYKLPLHFD